MITVVKHDGRQETFNSSKIEDAALKAGAEQSLAWKIAADVTDLFDAARNRHARQISARRERIVHNARRSCAYNNICYTVERHFTLPSRDCHIANISATLKRILLDTHDASWHPNALQAFATSKRLILDAPDAFRYRHASQTAAIIEHMTLDAPHTVRYGHAHQAAATAERHVFDALYTIWYNHVTIDACDQNCPILG